MKMKVGQKLFEIREDRKLNQTDFAELLGMSLPAYSRLERGETELPVDKLIKFSDILNVPIQEFLPDTLTFNNNNQHGSSGNICSTYNYFSNSDEATKELQHENEKQQLTIQRLEEKVALLENEIAFLRGLVESKK